MKNTKTILASVQAFMDNMQDGDMRELVANLQAALEYKNEELKGGMAKSHKIVRFQAAAVLYCRFLLLTGKRDREERFGVRVFSDCKKRPNPRGNGL